MNTNLVSSSDTHLLAQSFIGHESKLIQLGSLLRVLRGWNQGVASLGSYLETLGRINFQAYSSCWQIPFLVIIGLRSPFLAAVSQELLSPPGSHTHGPWIFKASNAMLNSFHSFNHFDFLYCQMEKTLPFCAARLCMSCWIISFCHITECNQKSNISSCSQVPPTLKVEGSIRGWGWLESILRILPTTDGLVFSELEIKTKWFFITDSLKALV